MKTFIAGGGLGDCVLILNKLRQLGGPQSRLIYHLAEKQGNSRPIIEEFWATQGVNCEIRMVPEISRPLNHYHHAGCKKLNPLIYGFGFIMVGKWKWVFYPFDALATPFLEFQVAPSPYEKYFVVQSDAGTMKYRGHKNWLNTAWINDFILRVRRSGLKCVLVGSKPIGIIGADHECLNLPLKNLFGIIKNAEFVLGLQGFITITALHMRKKVLLKRENFRVVCNYFHPAWRHHGKIFTEPANWPPAKTDALLQWALK